LIRVLCSLLQTREWRDFGRRPKALPAAGLAQLPRLETCLRASGSGISTPAGPITAVGARGWTRALRAHPFPSDHRTFGGSGQPNGVCDGRVAALGRPAFDLLLRSRIGRSCSSTSAPGGRSFSPTNRPFRAGLRRRVPRRSCRPGEYPSFFLRDAPCVLRALLCRQPSIQFPELSVPRGGPQRSPTVCTQDGFSGVLEPVSL
jgi:hypothetical protein